MTTPSEQYLDAIRYMKYEPRADMAQKESERFREFAEKFVLARAPDGPKGVWQAVLDAKTAYKQIEQATEEYARPERASVLAELEEKKRIMELERRIREQQAMAEYKAYKEAEQMAVAPQPEDKASWLKSEYDRWRHSPLIPVRKPPDPLSRKG